MSKDLFVGRLSFILKKFVVASSVATLITACGGSGDKEDTKPKATTTTTSQSVSASLDQSSLTFSEGSVAIINIIMTDRRSEDTTFAVSF
jgi:uncharacterized protein involved in outer membrane biogenesis